MNNWELLRSGLLAGDERALARAISYVENGVEGYELFLSSLPQHQTPVIGITGPPGAGKSTLVDQLIACMVADGKRVAVCCVDPSSPFNLGALLGDRVRMSNWYTHPAVFIRSLASRGSLGGLHPKIIEITDLLKSAGFDYIIVETVGVGQSEVEVAGLADVSVVTVVPEAGDEIQTMKAGLMEIADIFVVNKSDRPGADTFVKNLSQMLAPLGSHKEIPVIKTIAIQNVGSDLLYTTIQSFLNSGNFNSKKIWLVAEKAYQLMQQSRMKDVNKEELRRELEMRMGSGFNLYDFVTEKLSGAKQGSVD